MNRYEMLMKTADAIEQNPQRYSFPTTEIPKGPLDPACLLGEMWRQAGLVAA